MQGNAHKPRLRLIRQGFADRPAFGTAVSDVVLERVAAGEVEPTFRLHRPARELAFSKHDRASPGFAEAVDAARAVGFNPVVRLAGGRAAAFHEGSLAIAWAVPAAQPATETHARFERLATILVEALTGLGVEAGIGEVPGEYCPGAWSVHARGRVKLAGIGQRIISGGAHCGAVVVVSDSELLRSALVPVYEALGLAWDPATAGSVEDEAPGADLAAVEDAILVRLAERFELVEAELDSRTLELAAERESRHLA